MQNLTLEQLEQAQETLISRIRQSRGDHDYLTRELPRLVIGHALGTVTHDAIKAVRQQIAECMQVMEETPAALAIIKELIEQLRIRKQQDERQAEAKQTVLDYFTTRQTIIDNPILAGKQISAKLRGLASQADRDVSNGRLQKRETLFGSDAAELIVAAMEYNSRPQPGPFIFDVSIIDQTYSKEESANV